MAALDGTRWRGATLLVLGLEEARVKLAVHMRLKVALRKLTAQVC